MEIPDAFIGQPAFLAPAARNPYDGVGEVSSPDTLPEGMQRALVQARQSVREALAVTLVIPPDTFPGQREPFFTHLENQMNERSVDAMWVLDQNGENLFLSHRAALGDFIEHMGTSTQEFDRNLSSKENAIPSLDDRRTQALDALLKCPRDGVVVEFGAGTDFERMRRLQEYTHRKNAHLLCQDIVPRAAKVTSAKFPSLPYLSLPPHSQFQSPALQEIGAPMVFTLKNVLSSMSKTSIDEFLRVAMAVGPERIVATQTLGLSEESNFMAYGMRPGGEAMHARFRALFLQRLGNQYLEAIAEDHNLLSLATAFASVQCELTFSAMHLELVIQHLCNSPDPTLRYPHAKAFVVNDFADVPLKNIENYFKYVWQKAEHGPFVGSYNTFSLGPFGERFSKEKDVPRNHRRMRKTDLHIVLSHEPIKIPQVPKPAVLQVCDVQSGAFVTPRSLRYHAMDSCKRRAIHSVQGTMSPGAQRFLNTEQFLQQFQKAGAQIAHQMMFETNNPPVQQFAHRSADLHRHFCQ